MKTYISFYVIQLYEIRRFIEVADENLKNIGYVRTSTDRQDADNQILMIKDKGVPPELIFIDEGVSGITDPHKRQGFKAMMRYLDENPGMIERVYVFEVSRLGRKFMETLQIIEHLEKQKGVMIISLSPAETWFQIEDKGLRDGVILPILSWVASKEIENLKARINAGLDRARREGKTLGRPRREIDWKQVDLYRERKLSWSAIAKVLDISEGTLHSSHRRRMREQMINRAKEAKRE